MRWHVIWLAAVGCGRIGFDLQRVDAPIDALIDAPLDAPQLLETLTIPATGEVQVSTTTLVAGTSYRVVASGSCDISGVPPLLDAEYSFDAGQTAMFDLGDTGRDVGLGIDDAVFDSAVSPDWGPYRSDHIYTVDMIGSGQPITVQVHDSVFTNNTGSLTLEIYR